MKIKHISALVLIAIVLSAPRVNFAQGFHNGSMLIGPHVGLAAFGSAPAFGANFEVGVTDPGKAGPGVIGVSGRVDYFGFDDGFDKWTWLAFSVCGNYHFSMDAKMWDPFIGLGLGYQSVSLTADNASPFGNLLAATPLNTWGSGVYFVLNGGIRYFFSPGFDARAQVGVGVTYLVVGVDFGL